MKLPPAIPSTKEWKNVLEKKYKFEYINEAQKIPSDTLWTTSCSKTKFSRKKGIPTEFYRGRYNLLFYKYVQQYELDFGVLSDKYGIHLQDEYLEYYDVHPTELTMDDKKNLGKIIKKKVKENGHKRLIFYFPSPLMSKPYFEMLWFSKLPVFYISKIKLLDELEG